MSFTSEDMFTADCTIARMFSGPFPRPAISTSQQCLFLRFNASFLEGKMSKKSSSKEFPENLLKNPDVSTYDQKEQRAFPKRIYEQLT